MAGSVKWAATAAGLAAVVLAGPAIAQTATEGRTPYPAEFFAAAQPTTALDMVARLPGFVFDGGGDVRGLSGAQGNVLIDGRRPASKTEDLESLIRRIPAGQVLRIEVIRAGAPGVDMQGLPVVANIVRRQGGAIEGAFSAGTERHDDGRWAWETGLELSRSLSGDRRVEASGELYRYVDEDAGDGRRERRDAAGDVVRASQADQTGGGEGGRLSAAWRQPLAGGTLSANGLVLTERYDWSLEDRLRHPGPGLSVVDETEEDREAELGASWERPTAWGKVEVIGLQRLGDETVSSSAESAGGRERFDSEETAGESVGRISLSRVLSPWLTIEGAVEGAFNWREGKARAEEDGVVIDLPASDVRVEERRAELMTSAAWRPSARWSLEAGLRVETSELRQDGQGAAARTLTYAKPRLNLVWTPEASREWRLRIEREVGQLDFGDFITSASLDTGQVSAGNADLRPAAKWVVEAVHEMRFWGEGAVTLTVFHEAIEDAIDRVPVSSPSGVFDAPGNIGDAERSVAQVRVALPLSRLGVPGGLLKTFVEFAHTEATDPTTGERRRMSGYNPFEAEAEFTQDLPGRGLKWGVSAYFGSPYREFRFDEVSEEATEPWWSAFVEWKPRAAWVLTFEAENLTGRGYRLDRTLYDGPRDVAPVALVETRRQSFGPYVGLKVRRAFG